MIRHCLITSLFMLLALACDRKQPTESRTAASETQKLTPTQFTPSESTTSGTAKNTSQESSENKNRVAFEPLSPEQAAASGYPLFKNGTSYYFDDLSNGQPGWIGGLAPGTSPPSLRDLSEFRCRTTYVTVEEGLRAVRGGPPGKYALLIDTTAPYAGIHIEASHAKVPPPVPLAPMPVLVPVEVLATGDTKVTVVTFIGETVAKAQCTASFKVQLPLGCALALNKNAVTVGLQVQVASSGEVSHRWDGVSVEAKLEALNAVGPVVKRLGGTGFKEEEGVDDKKFYIKRPGLYEILGTVLPLVDGVPVPPGATCRGPVAAAVETLIEISSPFPGFVHWYTDRGLITIENTDPVRFRKIVLEIDSAKSFSTPTSAGLLGFEKIKKKIYLAGGAKKTIGPFGRNPKRVFGIHLQHDEGDTVGPLSVKAKAWSGIYTHDFHHNLGLVF